MITPDITTLDLLDARAAALVWPGERELANIFTELDTTIRTLELVYTPADIVARVPNIRRVAAGSPLVHRAQAWPKGYQGDYETIHHIISRENKAEPGSIGYFVEDFFLASDICAQHNNKVDAQSSLIADTLATRPKARILSIGCGTSEDLRRNAGTIKNTGSAITLVDIDRDAIAHSLDVLADIRDNVSVIEGNIYRIVRKLTDQYDLVIIGGVFDYLSDKVIVNVLSSLRERMDPGGVIFFTNIRSGNPFRIYMEYVAGWHLIERGEADMTRLLRESGCGGYATDIWLDATELTILVKVTVG